MATLRMLKSGRYNVQIRQKGQKPISATFDTEREATQWIQQQENPAPVISQASLYLSFYDLGIQYCRTHLAGRTSQAITLRRIELISPQLPKDVSDITQAHVNQYRLKRLQEVSGVTVRDELQLIHRLYRWAHRELILDSIATPSPCRNIPIPKGSKPRSKVIERDELQMLLSALSPVMASIVELAWETAMRRSEITKLTPDMLHLEERFLEVIDGKTGDRFVPLTQRAIELLTESLATARTPHAKLFPVTPHAVTTAVRRARKKVGLSDDVRLHQMRHSRISIVARKGLNQAQIMMVSGHRDVRSVQRYTHLNIMDVIDLID